jgi:hypothetical protein
MSLLTQRRKDAEAQRFFESDSDKFDARLRASEFDFSQGTEGKAKGRETASRRSTGGFNNGLE